VLLNSPPSTFAGPVPDEKPTRTKPLVRRTLSRVADPTFVAAPVVWFAEEELSVNQLHQLMIEELHRRNFAATTVRTYLHSVAHFSQYFRLPPDQLGPEDIRKYQAALFTTFKFSPNTVIA
jgi:hypothetical protein